MTAAISANLSTQGDTFVIGGRAGGGAHPGTWGVVSLIVNSDISTNSSFNSFFTIFCGMQRSRGVVRAGCPEKRYGSGTG